MISFVSCRCVRFVFWRPFLRRSPQCELIVLRIPAPFFAPIATVRIDAVSACLLTHVVGVSAAYMNGLVESRFLDGASVVRGYAACDDYRFSCQSAPYRQTELLRTRILHVRPPNAHIAAIFPG